MSDAEQQNRSGEIERMRSSIVRNIWFGICILLVVPISIAAIVATSISASQWRSTSSEIEELRFLIENTRCKCSGSRAEASGNKTIIYADPIAGLARDIWETNRIESISNGTNAGNESVRHSPVSKVSP